MKHTQEDVSISEAAKSFFDDEPAAANGAGEYLSTSSIDNPPKEPREGGAQLSLIDTDEEHEEEVQNFLDINIPEQFEVKLTLDVKPSGENVAKLPHRITVFHFSGPRERLEEMMNKSFHSKYFRQRLRGIIGEPQKAQPEQQESLERNPLTGTITEIKTEPKTDAPKAA